MTGKWEPCYQLEAMAKSFSIGIIGGGAAGYFAAINTARRHPNHKIYLFEASRRPLTKVLLSGGGRCNVTHNLFDPAKLVLNYPRGQKELRGAFHRFQPRDTIAWFEDLGIPLVSEPDGRMFPQSNESKTIANGLRQEARRWGIKENLGCRVLTVQKAATSDGNGFCIKSQEGPCQVNQVLLATGGSPFGFQLASELGHEIEPAAPSLFTFKIKDPLLEGLAGLSQPDSRLILKVPGHKKSLETRGPVLITHWGLSGPGVLKLSAFGARLLKDAQYQATLFWQLFASHTAQDPIDCLLAYQKQHPREPLPKATVFALPRRLWLRHLEVLGLETRTWNEVSQKMLRKLGENIYRLPLRITGKGAFKEEFVTAGGIRRQDVDFRTMESKKTPGLFFAGEILDVDGVTGGFNFQNAWTTGWIASQHMG